MPIALEPDERRVVWLATDAEKPIESRPVFVCAAPSRRKMIEYGRIRKLYAETTDDGSFFELILDAILLGVTGWKNIPVEFGREAMIDLLTEGELIELHKSWPKAFEITEEDRRGFPLRPQSDAAASVELAPPESATKSPEPSISTSPAE